MAEKSTKEVIFTYYGGGQFQHWAAEIAPANGQNHLQGKSPI
jgi:hypothetical protein